MVDEQNSTGHGDTYRRTVVFKVLNGARVNLSTRTFLETDNDDAAGTRLVYFYSNDIKVFNTFSINRTRYSNSIPLF